MFVSRTCSTTFFAGALGLALSVPVLLPAQSLTEVELGAPSAVVKDGIKSVHALRELADGRVLLVDSIAQKLLVADFATGKLETKMNGGSGANEFRTLSNLWKWTGDSVAVADLGKGQLHILSPDGALVRSARLAAGGGGQGRPMPGAGAPSGAPPGAPPAGRGAPAAGAPAAGARAFRGPVFTSLIGGTWLFGSGPPARPAVQTTALQPPRTLFPILRLSLQSMKIDTVAQLMSSQQPRTPQVNTSVGTFSVYVGTAPVQLLDSWTTLSDGTVAVIRAAPYRVDMYDMVGTRTQLDTIPAPAIPITNADKKRLVDEYKQVAAAALKSDPRRTSILAVAYEEPQNWPANHPPFRGDIAPVVDRQDRIWLATRCTNDEQAMCYDVIDRLGARVKRYKLPPKTTVMAFGEQVVYTVTEQKSDKSVIERHPLN